MSYNQHRMSWPTGDNGHVQYPSGSPCPIPTPGISQVNTSGNITNPVFNPNNQYVRNSFPSQQQTSQYIHQGQPQRPMCSDMYPGYSTVPPAAMASNQTMLNVSVAPKKGNATKRLAGACQVNTFQGQPLVGYNKGNTLKRPTYQQHQNVPLPNNYNPDLRYNQTNVVYAPALPMLSETPKVFQQNYQTGVNTTNYYKQTETTGASSQPKMAMPSHQQQVVYPPNLQATQTNYNQSLSSHASQPMVQMPENNVQKGFQPNLEINLGHYDHSNVQQPISMESHNQQFICEPEFPTKSESYNSMNITTPVQMSSMPLKKNYQSNLSNMQMHPAYNQASADYTQKISTNQMQFQQNAMACQMDLQTSSTNYEQLNMCTNPIQQMNPILSQQNQVISQPIMQNDPANFVQNTNSSLPSTIPMLSGQGQPEIQTNSNDFVNSNDYGFCPQGSNSMASVQNQLFCQTDMQTTDFGRGSSSLQTNNPMSGRQSQWHSQSDQLNQQNFEQPIEMNSAYNQVTPTMPANQEQCQQNGLTCQTDYQPNPTNYQQVDMSLSASQRMNPTLSQQFNRQANLQNPTQYDQTNNFSLPTLISMSSGQNKFICQPFSETNSINFVSPNGPALTSQTTNMMSSMQNQSIRQPHFMPHQMNNDNRYLMQVKEHMPTTLNQQMTSNETLMNYPFETSNLQHKNTINQQSFVPSNQYNNINDQNCTQLNQANLSQASMSNQVGCQQTSFNSNWNNTGGGQHQSSSEQSQKFCTLQSGVTQQGYNRSNLPQKSNDNISQHLKSSIQFEPQCIQYGYHPASATQKLAHGGTSQQLPSFKNNQKTKNIKHNSTGHRKIPVASDKYSDIQHLAASKTYNNLPRMPTSQQKSLLQGTASQISASKFTDNCYQQLTPLAPSHLNQTMIRNFNVNELQQLSLTPKLSNNATFSYGTPCNQYQFSQSKHLQDTQYERVQHQAAFKMNQSNEVPKLQNNQREYPQIPMTSNSISLQQPTFSKPNKVLQQQDYSVALRNANDNALLNQSEVEELERLLMTPEISNNEPFSFCSPVPQNQFSSSNLLPETHVVNKNNESFQHQVASGVNQPHHNSVLHNNQQEYSEFPMESSSQPRHPELLLDATGNPLLQQNEDEELEQLFMKPSDVFLHCTPFTHNQFLSSKLSQDTQLPNRNDESVRRQTVSEVNQAYKVPKLQNNQQKHPKIPMKASSVMLQQPTSSKPNEILQQQSYPKFLQNANDTRVPNRNDESFQHQAVFKMNCEIPALQNKHQENLKDIIASSSVSSSKLNEMTQQQEPLLNSNGNSLLNQSEADELERLLMTSEMSKNEPFSFCSPVPQNQLSSSKISQDTQVPNKNNESFQHQVASEVNQSDKTQKLQEYSEFLMESSSVNLQQLTSSKPNDVLQQKDFSVPNTNSNAVLQLNEDEVSPIVSVSNEEKQPSDCSVLIEKSTGSTDVTVVPLPTDQQDSSHTIKIDITDDNKHFQIAASNHVEVPVSQTSNEFPTTMIDQTNEVTKSTISTSTIDQQNKVLEKASNLTLLPELQKVIEKSLDDLPTVNQMTLKQIIVTLI